MFGKVIIIITAIFILQTPLQVFGNTLPKMPGDFLCTKHLAVGADRQWESWLSKKITLHVVHESIWSVIEFLGHGGNVNLEANNLDGHVSVDVTDISIREVLWDIQQKSGCRYSFQHNGALLIIEGRKK